MLLTRRISEVQELKEQIKKIQDGFSVHIVRLQQSVRKQTIENAELRQDFKFQLKKYKNLEKRVSRQEKRLDEAETERKKLSDFILILQNTQNSNINNNSDIIKPPINPYPSIKSLNGGPVILLILNFHVLSR